MFPKQERGELAVVDIHCHILPGVDDGAEDLAESLEMARMAVSCGVTDLAATPHLLGDSFDQKRLGLLYRQFQRLEHALKRENIPLKLHLGAEILCTSQTVDLAWAEQIPAIGDTRYVLCEFYFDTPGFQMDELLSGIAEAGFYPVVAHPERYDAVQQEPRWVQRWFHRGYVIQMNKGSVLGAFGTRVEITAHRLLDRGFVHILASDAHSAHRRTTDLAPLRSWLQEHCSQAYAQLLLEENPARLLRGREMAPVR